MMCTSKDGLRLTHVVVVFLLSLLLNDLDVYTTSQESY